MLSEGREPQCGEEEERVTVTPLDKGCPKPKPSEGNQRGEAEGASITLLGNYSIITEERETYRERKLMVLRFQLPEVLGEMVRAISQAVFFIFLFLYHVFIVTVQELTCSASYGVNKTPISKHNNKRKTITFRLQVCQVLDTSPNIWLTKESKITVKAKQTF